MGFFFFLPIFWEVGLVRKKGIQIFAKDSRTVSGGLFSLQLTSNSLHNNTHQPGVCSNRNRVSSWTHWKTAPSAQEAESTGLCCPNKFFSKALCRITCVSVSWGTSAGRDACCLHWSPYSNPFLLPKIPWQSTTSSDDRITFFSDKTFVFLHKLILWYNSSPCTQTHHFTTGSYTAVEYKWPVQVTSDSFLIHAAI